MPKKKVTEIQPEFRNEIAEDFIEIAELTTDFNRADLNELRDKLNEVIRKVK